MLRKLVRKFVGDSDSQEEAVSAIQVTGDSFSVTDMNESESLRDRSSSRQEATDSASEKIEEGESGPSLEDGYFPASWPGPLVGKFPPPLPYIPKPRLAVDPTEVLNFPDIVIDSHFQPDAGFAACISIRGNKKRHYGSSRQDSVAIFATESEVGAGRLIHFLLVADGVGGADLSHLASRKAVTTAMAELKMRADSHAEWKNQCAEVFSAVAAGLTAFADERSLNVSRLVTTLRIAKVVPSEVEGQSRVFSACVGDGVTYHLDSNGEPKDSLSGESGFGHDDEVSTATKALPYHAEYFEFKEFLVNRGESVVVATDGAQEVWTAGISLGSLIANQNTDALQIAWALDVKTRSATDDRSLSFWRQV